MDDPKYGFAEYGDASVPPSAEAGSILSLMTKEEKFNFTNLLRNLQEEFESAGEKGPLKFHAEVRAALWGLAFAKIADHYRGLGQDEKTMFFMSAAWHTSKYPVFAFNIAILSILDCRY
jgi:hypothetical protein